LLRHPLVAHFAEATYVDTSTTSFAETPVDTRFGKVLGTAAELLGEWPRDDCPPRCLWIHLRGFLAAWDAPPELAESLLDEEVPPLEPALDVPAGSFGADEQADDEILHASARYAAQVMALDECLGGLESVLDE